LKMQFIKFLSEIKWRNLKNLLVDKLRQQINYKNRPRMKIHDLLFF
jgi:hypothetical protein